MGTLIIQSQLGALENGLKDLKRSRLMQIREFKDMYSAIESHHRDLRLAHLTGMAKDIMVQAEQDTRFFHILIKMMCEVKQTSSVKQKDSLIKVHHWYNSNKNILHTRPRFGRQRKDSTPTKTPTSATSRAKTASAKRVKSSNNKTTNKQQTPAEQPTVRLASADGSKNRIFCETPSARTESPFKTAFDLDLLPSNRDYVNDYLSTNYYSEGDNKMASLQHFLNDLPGPPSRMSDFHTGSHVTGHQHVEIKKPGSLDDSGGTPPGSLREDVDGSAVSPDYIDSLIDYSHKVDDVEDEDDPDFEVEVTIGGEDSDMPESRRKLSRGRTPSASLHREQVLSEQSSNISIALPKKMIHPIASLVNPHATLAAAEARRAEEEYLNSRQSVHTPLRPSRYPRKLNFVGRSGTAQDVRYSSHGSGEAPERDTPGILAYFATESHPMVMQSPIQVDTENRLLNRPLEEFYQMAEEYYPSKPQKYHHPVVAKPTPPKPAPPTSARSETTSKSVKIQPLGKNLLDNDEKPEEKDNVRSDVKLDAVVHMIDAVSEDMVYFKERLAPQPIAGFRQPASHGVSMKPLSRPATATGVRSQSPIMRTNTPVGNHGNLTRSLSNPYLSQDILIGEETVNPRSARSMPSSRMTQAIDWRGKIAPDSVRSKWKNKQFGDHTFVKRMIRGKRPVGATHAGSRPKTAPVTAREKWKTDKPSDQNTRVEGQAATNTMTLVDQNAVDSMMQVQHILGSSDSRAGSFNSLYMDENFLRSLNSRMTSAGGSTNTNTPVPMEYVPIVANAPRSLPESRSHSRLTKKSERTESRIQEIEPEDDVEQKHLEVDEAYSQKGVVTTTPIDPVLDQAKTPEGEREPVTDKNEEDLESESRDQVSELPGESLQGDTTDKVGEVQGTVEAGEGDKVTKAPQQEEDSAPTYREPVHFSEELHNGDVHLEVLAIPSGGRTTSPPRVKHGTVQELSTSESWNFSPNEEDVKERRNISTPKFQVRGEHWLKNLVKPENYCFECIPESMSTKVGRQAGRMPNRTQSASSQVLCMSRKQTEYFKKAPPLRTPPSIPTVPHRQPVISEQSPRYGQTYNPELEHHARSTKSPRHFMEHVVDLRASGIRSAPPGSHWGLEGGLSSSLTVSGLTSRQNTTIMRPGLQHERTMYPNGSHIETLSDGTKHVVFDDEVTESSQRLNGTEEPMDSSTGDQDRFKSGTTMKSRKSNQSIAHVGRPIAHFHNIKDPHETGAAFKVHKEAQAAVDIQRIFRGYVARNMYKKLIKDEREKMEDKQKAAVEIQRVYRGHLIRKKAILNRPPVSKESLEWAKELKITQAEKAQKRQNKMEALANKNQLNHQTNAAKISQIGPHVEIYQIYHPKITGPTKKEMYDAATSIQKNVRGFLVKCRFDRLRRKAVWYGSTWQKMVKDYKNSLKRCQQRHGVDRAKTPFTIEFMNDYMEARRRYESVFEKKAFAGEMEFEELDQFFRECDLYPSQSEIDESVDVVFQGQASSRKGLRKNDVMELVWYIYTPKAAGLPNMRQSTWLNPIIDGVEARKLIGSEYVENAPLETCAKLVIDSKRERREKEQREKDKLQEEEAAQMKRELSEFQYDDDDENEGIKGELARTRTRLSSYKSLEDSCKKSTN